MKFCASTLAAFAVVSLSAFGVSAFTAPKTALVSNFSAIKNVYSSAGCSSGCSSGCSCAGCASTANAAGCCPGCAFMTALRMSTEETAEVPVEVVAMDGVADEEEAHNVERPARDSGIKKHKGAGGKGTPISDLVIGSYVDGTVKTVTSYGAFVDIGAASDALLHVSRLSNEFVSNVEDIVKAGDKVNVRIAGVDAEKNQIAISMISEDDENAAKAARGGGRRKDRPQRSGGDRAAQAATISALDEAGYDDTKMVEGEVVSALDFGAFVRFDASQVVESVTGELDGLVHISALVAGRADSVQSIVSIGDKVQIRVRGLDVEGGKVSLSMITKEEEEENRPKRRPQRRGRQMFDESEMGAKDWKESMEKFHTENPEIKNMPVIVDKRKVSA